MPIPRDEFRALDEDGTPLCDLSPDTTPGKVFRFLLDHADKAFSRSEVEDAVDVPAGSVEPTLERLERRGLVEHRDRYWAVADPEHAVASAGLHGTVTADDVDGGFSDEEVEVWMEMAVEPIEDEGDETT